MRNLRTSCSAFVMVSRKFWKRVTCSSLKRASFCRSVSANSVVNCQISFISFRTVVHDAGSKHCTTLHGKDWWTGEMPCKPSIWYHPPTLKGRRHQSTANLLETSNPKLSSWSKQIVAFVSRRCWRQEFKIEVRTMRQTRTVNNRREWWPYRCPDQLLHALAACQADCMLCACCILSLKVSVLDFLCSSPR